jgi:hypothetical protein
MLMGVGNEKEANEISMRIQFAETSKDSCSS